jgi:asparagine synthase (glutamine-hydrolysing)
MDWIMRLDGEYVVLIYDRKARCNYVFTDALGRLPLYCFQNNDSVVLARECKFILALRGRTAFDRVGCAQSLWIGYPLGERTLFEDVVRAPAAMLLISQVEVDRLRTTMSQVVQFNFDDKDYSGQTIEHRAVELVNTFTSAVHDRGSHPDIDMNVIALSGGQDSRAVAATMKRANLECVATTYVTPSGRGLRDSQIAERIANELDIRWYRIALPASGVQNEQLLVSLKDGLNFVSMGFILSFTKEIASRWGRAAAYVTGDGGDKVFPDLRLVKPVRSTDALIAGILQMHSCVSSELAESVFDLEPGRLENELQRLFSRYPETDLNQKAVHFAIHERGRKWLYEGEDRTRFFLWQTSPFYSLPFFQRAFQVPDDLKRHNRLYRAFQIRLSPAIARIPDANMGYPVQSRLFGWKLMLEQQALKLPKRIRDQIKSIMHMPAGRPFQVPNHTLLYVNSTRLMNSSAVRKMLSKANERQFSNWWTLALTEKSLSNLQSQV